MRNPLKELYNANDAVEHSIDRLEFEGRSAVSRDVVGYLRHLVEHIAMYATYGNKPIEGDYFKLCSVAIKDMSKNSETRFIAKFHHYLQKVVSHYVPSEDSAERLLLKYYENLLCLKRYAFDKLGLTILANLSKIPLDTDPGLAKYHEEIAHKINDFMSANAVEIEKDRFYVRLLSLSLLGILSIMRRHLSPHSILVANLIVYLFIHLSECPLIIQWWFRLSARVSTVLALLFLLRLLMHMRFQYAPVS